MAADGIARIYKEDLDSQRSQMRVISNRVRKLDEVDYLLDASAFFVPNNEYMLHFFGPECTDPSYDIYIGNSCLWNNYIVFPVCDVMDKPVGFAGFDPIAKTAKDAGDPMSASGWYRYSARTVFNRGKYLYGVAGWLDRALRDGYVIVTDGIFDMLAFVRNGMSAACLMGSMLSEEVIFQLSLIPKVFIAQDNDKAGRDTALQLKGKVPQTRILQQNLFKDADDIIKSKFGDRYLQEVSKAVANHSDLKLRFSLKS